MNGDKQLLHRFIQSRPHLSLAIGLGILVGLLMPESVDGLTRALIGWNATVWTYLVSMAWVILRADHHKVREICDSQDESAGLVLVTLTLGAVLSLSAIVSEVRQIPHLSPDLRVVEYIFTALTISGSWFLVGVLFTFHYAHLYYRDPSKRLPLRFPGRLAEPDYWDFLYFSFTISVAVQTSDVAVISRTMRKLVLGQSVLSFFFNLAILGLSINIAAGLINQ
jgi:uncharacterized membrane protein